MSAAHQPPTTARRVGLVDHQPTGADQPAGGTNVPPASQPLRHLRVTAWCGWRTSGAHLQLGRGQLDDDGAEGR